MKTLLIGLLLLTTSAFAQYKLYTVDKIEFLENKTFKVTFTVPCQDVDFESFVAAYDDSGEMDLRVGVVLECDPGPAETYTRTISKDQYEETYQVLKSVFENETIIIVPMLVAN